jgi:hypothetical protein
MEPAYLDYLSPWLRGFCSGISNKSNRPDNCLQFPLLLSHFVCHGFILNVRFGWQALYAKSVLRRDAPAPLLLYVVQLDTLGAPMVVRDRFFCLFFLNHNSRPGLTSLQVKFSGRGPAGRQWPFAVFVDAYMTPAYSVFLVEGGMKGQNLIVPGDIM